MAQFITTLGPKRADELGLIPLFPVEAHPNPSPIWANISCRNCGRPAWTSQPFANWHNRIPSVPSLA